MTPHIEKTKLGFTKRNKTRKEAMVIRLIIAARPTQTVDVGLTDVDTEYQLPRQISLVL